MIRVFLFAAVIAAIPVLVFFCYILVLFFFVDEYIFEDFAWKTVGAYYAFFIAAVLSSFFAGEGTLWRALRGDYPGRTLEASTWPQSVGIFGSVTHGDVSNALTYATKEALHACRVRRYLAKSPWIEIPWSKIESIEILEPNAESVQSAATREAKKILSWHLHARVKLARKNNPLTLMVPWSEEFSNLVPTDIEIVRNWQWPYSVM